MLLGVLLLKEVVRGLVLCCRGLSLRRELALAVQGRDARDRGAGRAWLCFGRRGLSDRMWDHSSVLEGK